MKIKAFVFAALLALCGYANAVYTIVTEYTGTVDNSGTATCLPLGAFHNWVTIQNTDAVNTLYLSMASPVSETKIVLKPGGAITFPFGVANVIYGKSSGTVTSFTAVGY